MPATVKFLEELERAFKKGDIDQIISLGVRMLHMGWLGKLDWFLERFNSILDDLSSEDLKKLERERFPELFRVIMYVIRDMEPEKALPYIRGSKSLVEKRIFHEYLGNHPRAYHYLRLSEREMGFRGFWVEIRKMYFRMYRGQRVKIEEVEALETSEDELEFVAQVITKGYAIALHHLLFGDISPETFARIKKTVIYGLSENYDHTTARLLQVFIPLAVEVGRVGLARRFLNAVISTSQTERNRYMYEWFTMYRMAMGEGDGDILKRKIAFYMDKGYKGHETLARSIYYLLGNRNRDNLERIKELKEKYWHYHTVRFAEALTGRPLT